MIQTIKFEIGGKQYEATEGEVLKINECSFYFESNEYPQLQIFADPDTDWMFEDDE